MQDTYVLDTVTTTETEHMAKDTEKTRQLSALDRIKQLEAEKAELLESATQQALAEARIAVEQLNMLGLRYQLVEANSPPRAVKPRSESTGAVREKRDEPCKVCGFKTEPLHDARKHRSQGEDKQPFTLDELMELGLKRLD